MYVFGGFEEVPIGTVTTPCPLLKKRGGEYQVSGTVINIENL